MLIGSFYVGLTEPTQIDLCKDVLEMGGWVCPDSTSQAI